MRVYPKFAQVEQAMIPHRGRALSTREIAGLAGVCVSTCRVALWSMAQNPEIPLRKLPEKTANYEALVRLAAAESMRGGAPFAGPVSAFVEIEITPPASWSKRRREQALAGEIRPTTKPDIDNALKSIFDAINGVVWDDDRQVVLVSASKRYAQAAGAMVAVEEVFS